MMSWQMAEELAAEHMRRMGFLEVQRAADGPDGGVDVWGKGVVAQVKHWSTPVGIAEVQRLRGTFRDGHALFYSQSGYTKAATEWGSANQVALFIYDQNNTVTSLNDAAELFARLGPIEDLATIRELLAQVDLQAQRCRIASDQLLNAASAFFAAEPTYCTEDVVNIYLAHTARLKSFQDHLNEQIHPYARTGIPMPVQELRELLGALQDWEDTIVAFWGAADTTILEKADFFRVPGEGWSLKNGVTEDKKTPIFSKSNLPPGVSA